MGFSSLKAATCRCGPGAPDKAQPLAPSWTTPSMACLTEKSVWEKSALASANLAICSGAGGDDVVGGALAARRGDGAVGLAGEFDFAGGGELLGLDEGPDGFGVGGIVFGFPEG